MNNTEQPPTDTQPPAAPAAKLAPAPKPPKKTELRLRVNYTRDEIVELAKKLAETVDEQARAEDEKKAVNGQMKAKVDGITARMGEITGKITSGFEYRLTACEVRYDDPKQGLKTVIRLDNQDVVSCEPMSLSELQSELPLSADSDNVVAFTKEANAIAGQVESQVSIAEKDARAIAKAKKAADRVAVRKSTPGTVEVAADEGTRDDAGTEGKNDF